MAPTEIYTLHIVGSVRCVQETDAEYMGLRLSFYLKVCKVNINACSIWTIIINLTQHPGVHTLKRLLTTELERQMNGEKKDGYAPVDGGDQTFISCNVAPINSAKIKGEPTSVPKVQKNATKFHLYLSLIHISEPTRLGMISYAVFCLKKKKKNKNKYQYQKQDKILIKS
eukprot:TRINITY_DN37225_c0_g1_i1.p1 TRINITY_DN37225_c0_g1~~TRINITY_DN37225_c0_g1_i1.p1  ORF type:complete len:170 (+),score=23.72 TRINITY_DN37225_c0_g1_i1:48-557(+)